MSMIAAIVSIVAVLALLGLLAVAALVVVAFVLSGSRSRVATSAPASSPATEDGPPRTRGWQRDLITNSLDSLLERRAIKELLGDVTEAASDEQQRFASPATRPAAAKSK